jgi:hypothetical protein
MYKHFPRQFQKNRFPLKIGTTTTERIISIIQGQTILNQHLDKQPTYAAMLHRMRGVEENQQILDELENMGVTERVSNRRREVKRQANKEMFEELPSCLEDFKQELKICHSEGVRKARSIIEQCLPKEFNEKLKQHHDDDNISAWESPYIFSHPHYLAPSNDPPFLDINFADLEVDEMEIMEEQLPLRHTLNILKKLKSSMKSLLRTFIQI